METIRWGIIGCGDVTEVKSGPGFQRVDGSQLQAVMRRNIALAQDYALRHSVPKWYGDAAQLISDPEVDAVYIATPPSSHKHYTLLAAASHKPVYVEKPMAINFDECRAMITACRAANVPLFVAYYRRALDRFLKIRELVQGGAIGEVRSVAITFLQSSRISHSPEEDLPWRVRPEIAGGGLFVDLASHMLDFLDYLLGPISSVRGFADNLGGLYPAEDVVTGAFVFESGVQGTGLWNFTAAEDLDRTEIIGTKGSIAYSTFDAEPVRLKNDQGMVQFDIPYPPHIQQPLIQKVVDAIRGTGDCPSTGESGARTSRVIDQFLTDYRSRSG